MKFALISSVVVACMTIYVSASPVPVAVNLEARESLVSIQFAHNPLADEVFPSASRAPPLRSLANQKQSPSPSA
ncbi:hypothetical protein NLJ89_g4958 [Agrocybe chaxingu]|uniref:Uncharacterized protein n=1 Tax=Agrocybe chaxingu TaxID=84603 RepID=A0A9W8K1X9_9AGAR|nr:hypothetical protein NLJ89_g4958 [Agrocybe chaxingu]